MLEQELQQQLISFARDTIALFLETGETKAINPVDWPNEMFEPGASFVTLNLNGQLRGCIGTLEAHEALIENIRDNAINAAFRDPRFPALSKREFENIELEISILGMAELISFNNCRELETLLIPHKDGLILEANGRRSVFLPQVWESLPEAATFIQHLKTKGGIPLNTEPPELKAWRFTVEHFD